MIPSHGVGKMRYKGEREKREGERWGEDNRERRVKITNQCHEK